ncbi:CD209 antigen-like protein E [Leptotrombidium deliense]|uniref:CD209 antigen-like protein E n=1 Tax=Leptotrombidium deliense TaxID=299467 RepID=A0A443RYC6_9ACAR|nr:CD209 antigen-like protein E [Leptotrombidium deliense]
MSKEIAIKLEYKLNNWLKTLIKWSLTEKESNKSIKTNNSFTTTKPETNPTAAGSTNGKNVEKLLITTEATTTLLPAKNKVETCPEGWTQRKQKCYKLDNLNGTFAQRIKHCASISASVLTINSDEENKFVIDTFGDSYWIGAVRLKGTKVFVKFDKNGYLSFLVYDNWDQGEPGNRFDNENCIVFSSKGFWHDFACHSNFRGICEKYLNL